MSVQNQIKRLEDAKAALKTSIEGKGVTVPSNTKIDAMADLVDAIEVPAQQTKTVKLSMASGDQIISPDSGKVLAKVTVNKPVTLIPENIRKGVVIGGVTGTMKSSSGSASETWVWNSALDPIDIIKTTYSCNFTCNGQPYSSISIDSVRGIVKYGSIAVYDDSIPGWDNDQYRKITFLESPTGDLPTFLQTNAVKQPFDQAIQTDKSLTITSNGTTTITPDAPYDAMSKVDVTVNVAGSSGGLSLDESYYSDLQTWLINEYPDGNVSDINTLFFSNGRIWTSFNSAIHSGGGLFYGNSITDTKTDVLYPTVEVYNPDEFEDGWQDDAYRQVTFLYAPFSEVQTWLKANATKIS